MAYIVFEVLPGASRSPVAQRTAGQARKLIDPEGRYRELSRTLDMTPTIANRRALADECLALGRVDEAETHYRQALTGIHSTDPATMLGLARASFAKGDPAGCLMVLDALRASNPDYRNAHAHMLYSRCLESLSRNADALKEYEDLAQYYGGEEPKVRRALLLLKMGDLRGAQDGFEEVVRSVDRAPSFYRRNQREWYGLARQNLKARGQTT